MVAGTGLLLMAMAVFEAATVDKGQCTKVKPRHVNGTKRGCERMVLICWASIS